MISVPWRIFRLRKNSNIINMKNMRNIPFFAAAIVILGLSGCMTIGRPIDAAKIRSIAIGVSTEKDLIDNFGEPYRRGVENGMDTATWVYYRIRMSADQQTRDLFVKFDRQGKVSSYSFNSSIAEDYEAIRQLPLPAEDAK